MLKSVTKTNSTFSDKNLVFIIRIVLENLSLISLSFSFSVFILNSAREMVKIIMTITDQKYYQVIILNIIQSCYY